MTHRVLVTDKLAEEGLALLRAEKGIEVIVDTRLAKDPPALAKALNDADGIAVRSGTQLTADVLQNQARLKAIVRAGVGVDNIDVPAATRQGIVVMNTPGGNTVSTAEHTMALMLALARNVARANDSLKSGKWDRNAFTGTQLEGKTLGVVGLGRVGLAVARCALGFGMTVVGFDPLLSAEKALENGIESVSRLDELWPRCDFISLHTPLNAETRNLIDARAIGMMKPSVRIINCAGRPDRRGRPGRGVSSGKHGVQGDAACATVGNSVAFAPGRHVFLDAKLFRQHGSKENRDGRGATVRDGRGRGDLSLPREVDDGRGIERHRSDGCGVLGDRALALVDAENGKVVSAKNPRRWPNLFDFRAAYVEPPRDAHVLPPARITLPDGDTVSADEADVEPRLSASLGRTVRLTRSAFEGAGPRDTGQTTTGSQSATRPSSLPLPAGTFFDCALVHLITTATLDRLRSIAPASRFEPRRFRPNFVIQPADGATGFVENDWIGRTLQLGNVLLHVSGPCPRCVMTTLGQGDLPKDPGVLRTVVHENDGNAGVYASVVRGGLVHRGDDVFLS